MLIQALALLTAAAAVTGPYRFDSPEVLDLSDAQRLEPLRRSDVAITPLARDAATAIVKMPDVDLDSKIQMPFSPEAAPSKGKMLAIKTQSGKVVTFKDWLKAASKDADGDSEHYVELAPIGAMHYRRVEVQFGQDSPGSFLVNPQSGKTAFVHNGGDVAVLSPGGTSLVTMNTLNSPFLISVASLDAIGPSLSLACRGAEPSPIKSSALKGWRDDKTFDVVLTIVENAPVALRITLDGNAWRVASADPALLKNSGYGCWTP